MDCLLAKNGSSHCYPVTANKAPLEMKSHYDGLNGQHILMDQIRLLFTTRVKLLVLLGSNSSWLSSDRRRFALRVV